MTGRFFACAQASDDSSTAAAPSVARPDVVIVGFGPAGQAVATALYENHQDRMTVIELNPRTAAAAQQLGLPVHFGDARHHEVLEHAGVARAKVIAITVPDASATRAIPTLLWDARFRLFTTVLAGFGRAIGEVGAVIVVGGNIAHSTRVMTTAIALETSKGDLPLALGLGLVLLLLALCVNAGAALLRDLGERLGG